MAASLPRVVIVGGGVAALEVLIGLRKLAAGLYEPLLLCPAEEFVYRPLSVTEPFELGKAPHFELGRIAAEHGARQVVDTLERVDSREMVLHTGTGDRLSYEDCVIAVGAVTRPAVDGALTFTGSRERAQLSEMLEELELGEIHDLAFVVPTGVVWALPAYELALMSGERMAKRGVRDARISLVTSEQAPLRLFGRKASRRIADLLERNGIELHTSATVTSHTGDRLELVSGRHVEAQRVVAMPQLQGPAIAGLDHDGNGFLRTDGYGIVDNAPHVYAAGDITNFPVKQGGIATQQADAIVSRLASSLGADVEPRPFRPVLRGLLLSEHGPNYLRADIAGGRGDESVASNDPLWWPAGKIMGRYLSPYLAGLGVTPGGHPGRAA